MQRRLPGWRSVAATWGGAAFLLLRQFGMPAPAGVLPETRIVRVSEESEQLAASERTPDGRILTLPVEQRSERSRQDSRVHSETEFGVN